MQSMIGRTKLKAGITSGAASTDRCGAVLQSSPKSALLHAIHRDDLSAVINCLTNGSDPIAPDEDGTTPLHAAAALGRVDICHLLLQHGAQASVANKAGFTPLQLATFSGRPDLYNLLMDQTELPSSTAIPGSSRAPSTATAAEGSGSTSEAAVGTTVPSLPEPGVKDTDSQTGVESASTLDKEATEGADDGLSCRDDAQHHISQLATGRGHSANGSLGSSSGFTPGVAHHSDKGSDLVSSAYRRFKSVMYRRSSDSDRTYEDRSETAFSKSTHSYDTVQLRTTLHHDTVQPMTTRSNDTGQPRTTASNDTEQTKRTRSNDAGQPMTTVSNETAQPMTIVSKEIAQPMTIVSKEIAQPMTTHCNDTAGAPQPWCESTEAYSTREHAGQSSLPQATPGTSLGSTADKQVVEYGDDDDGVRYHGRAIDMSSRRGPRNPDHAQTEAVEPPGPAAIPYDFKSVYAKLLSKLSWAPKSGDGAPIGYHTHDLRPEAARSESIHRTGIDVPSADVATWASGECSRTGALQGSNELIVDAGSCGYRAGQQPRSTSHHAVEPISIDGSMEAPDSETPHPLTPDHPHLFLYTAPQSPSPSSASPSSPTPRPTTAPPPDAPLDKLRTRTSAAGKELFSNFKWTASTLELGEGLRDRAREFLDCPEQGMDSLRPMAPPGSKTMFKNFRRLNLSDPEEPQQEVSYRTLSCDPPPSPRSSTASSVPKSAHWQSQSTRAYGSIKQRVLAAIRGRESKILYPAAGAGMDAGARGPGEMDESEEVAQEWEDWRAQESEEGPVYRSWSQGMLGMLNVQDSCSFSAGSSYTSTPLPSRSQSLSTVTGECPGEGWYCSASAQRRSQVLRRGKPSANEEGIWAATHRTPNRGRGSGSAFKARSESGGSKTSGSNGCLWNSSDVLETFVAHQLKEGVQLGDSGRFVIQSLLPVKGAHVAIVYDLWECKEVFAKFYIDPDMFKTEVGFYLFWPTLGPNIMKQTGRLWPGIKRVFEEGTIPSINAGCVILEKGDMSLSEVIKEWAATDRAYGDRYEEGLVVVQHVLQCLAMMHEYGWVHRDLKPSNVVLFEEGHRWCVVDFGITGQAGMRAPIQYTMLYAPPEAVRDQFNGEDDVLLTTAMDMWSLGMLIFDMFCWSTALKELKQNEWMHMLLGLTKFPFENNPSWFQQHVPKDIAAVLATLLVRTPGSRPTVMDLITTSPFATNQ